MNVTATDTCPCGRSPTLARGLCRACYCRAWKRRRVAEDGRAGIGLPPTGFRSCLPTLGRAKLFGPQARRPRRWIGRRLGRLALLADVVALARLEGRELI
jgi:hypothetical protein